MQKTLSINVHTPDAKSAADVDRRHYTVAALIAELNKYDGETVVVVNHLAAGKFGSIDYQGLSLHESEPSS